MELKQARQRLREMNDEKNEFMGIAAHDLRCPLNVIKGFSEMIVEDLDSLKDGTVEKLAAVLPGIGDHSRQIRVTVERMAEMVQKLLDANAIERGELKLDVQPCELSAIVRSVVDVYRSKAAAKQQSLLFENQTNGVMLPLDKNVTVQILENLLSNAIKYSPLGKKTVVRCTSGTGAIRCEVKDEGPGLSLEDQKKLFGKFARLSAKPTGGERATGLGLSIVKRMVEAMNGRIWCESQPGQGASFIVEFPEP